MRIIFMSEIGSRLSIKPLSLSEDANRILLFGLPLFGCWLPYVGFTTFLFEEDGEEIEVRCFLIQFLLFGVIFAYGIVES